MIVYIAPNYAEHLFKQLCIAFLITTVGCDRFDLFVFWATLWGVIDETQHPFRGMTGLTNQPLSISLHEWYR